MTWGLEGVPVWKTPELNATSSFHQRCRSCNSQASNPICSFRWNTNTKLVNSLSQAACLGSEFIKRWKSGLNPEPDSAATSFIHAVQTPVIICIITVPPCARESSFDNFEEHIRMPVWVYSSSRQVSFGTSGQTSQQCAICTINERSPWSCCLCSAMR